MSAPKDELQSLSNRWAEVVSEIRELGSDLENRFGLLIQLRKDLTERGITLKADFEPHVLAALESYRSENRGAGEAPV